MASSKDNKDLTLSDKYKLKGAQQLTYAEYQALKTKNSKPRFTIPPFVKFILGTPFIIIFCCGVIFIPYMLYIIATSPSAPAPTDKTEKTNDTAR